MFAARSLIHRPAAFVSNLRHIHSSPAAYKSVTEKVGEVADKVMHLLPVALWYLTIEQVNKSVGKGLADAIDKGEKATNAAKDTIGGSVLHMTY